MIVNKLKRDYPVYVFFAMCIVAISLIFNQNIWYDESFTLSLIGYNFGDMLNIIKSDMHPPLYFVSLKLFCNLFGYSILATKIFSLLGHIGTLLIGCTIVKKRYGNLASAVFMLTLSGTPYILYFSSQQRAYSWCIFFVTLCFLEALQFLQEKKTKHCVAYTVAGTLAAYNHIFALLAIGIIFAFVNICTFVSKRDLLKKVLLADLCIILMYIGWFFVLLKQTASASNNFWLNSVEKLSVKVFLIGIAFGALFLLQKKCRKLPVVFALVCVMSIQIIGLFTTIFIRPFYIARYCVVVSGIFAFAFAFVISQQRLIIKKIALPILCLFSVLAFIFTARFEYNSSLQDFRTRMETRVNSCQTFLYKDSTFGVISYYFPECTHISTRYKPWFDAFPKVEYVSKKEAVARFNKGDKAWHIINAADKIPDYIEENFSYKLVDEYKNDLNYFYLYELTKK